MVSQVYDKLIFLNVAKTITHEIHENYGNYVRNMHKVCKSKFNFSETVYQSTRKLAFRLQDIVQFYVKIHPDPQMTVTLLNIYI